jgi:hypothetical protein
MENTEHGEAPVIEGVESEALPPIVDERPQQEQQQAVGEQDEAKKFQSMYDRKTAEYERLNSQVEELRKYEQLGNVLKQRPDVVDAMRQQLSGQVSEPQQEQQSKGQVDEDSFDPWEAYYKPGSPSYEMRVGQERALVSEAVNDELSGIREQVALNNVRQELTTKYGMEDPAHVNDFLQFATNPRDEVPLDVLIDVYRKHRGVTNEQAAQNMEAVHKSQNIAPTAGIVQGAAPEKPSEMDDVWSGIMNASNKNRI